MVQHDFGCWQGSRTSIKVFILHAPRAHRLQDRALGELLGQGGDWTHAAVSPQPLTAPSSFSGAREGRSTHWDAFALCPHRRSQAFSWDAGKRVCKHIGPGSTPTRSPLVRPARGQPGRRQRGNKPAPAGTPRMEKSPNKRNLAEILRRGPVNLLSVTLPASRRAPDPGGESPCSREGRKLAAERP